MSRFNTLMTDNCFTDTVFLIQKELNFVKQTIIVISDYNLLRKEMKITKPKQTVKGRV